MQMEKVGVEVDPTDTPSASTSVSWHPSLLFRVEHSQSGSNRLPRLQGHLITIELGWCRTLSLVTYRWGQQSPSSVAGSSGRFLFLRNANTGDHDFKASYW